MFLQRFLILLMLWVLSLITTNVIAAPTFGASPTAGSMIKFSSTESGGAVSQTIRITNNGVDPLEITSAVFGLTNPSNFTFSGAESFLSLTRDQRIGCISAIFAPHVTMVSVISISS